MSDQVLDELRRIGEELRQAFADERRAISSLDHGRLVVLAAHKEQLASQLSVLREPALATGSAAVKDLFAAIRVEAQATAILATSAVEAVRLMLGYQSTGGYDRRAHRTSSVIPRLLVSY